MATYRIVEASNVGPSFSEWDSIEQVGSCFSVSIRGPEMKTTVKLDQNRAVVVNSAKGGKVAVDLATFGITAFTASLTPDQAYVLGEALQVQAGLAEGQK